jgi:hypothetical protein
VTDNDNRVVFSGEDDTGTEVRVEWRPGDDADTVYVTTRRSPFARWTPPVECSRTDD